MLSTLTFSNRRYAFALIALLCFSGAAWAQISIPNTSFTYTEKFNTLPISGIGHTAVPAGWAFFETSVNFSDNTTFRAGDASGLWSDVGVTYDTYSLGATGTSDRAFGSITNTTQDSLNTTIGACFTNNTGATITSLTITYTGETWRVASQNRVDGLVFQYNQNTTAINGAGTWTAFTALNYFNPGAPTVGGGSIRHSAVVSATISGLNIAPGNTFCFRWLNFNSTAIPFSGNANQEDAIGIDDFSLGNIVACAPPVVSAPNVTQPTCATPTGTIVVNATGIGVLEYSINNGSTWQTTNTYGGQAPGSYNIKVRLQANPTCETTYGSNPVVLSSPFTASTTSDTWTGCVSTDWAVAGNWADGSVPTVADDAVIPNTTNKPTIFGGTAAVAKTVEVRAGTTLTIAATASLTVNGSKSVAGTNTAFLNDGTVQNNGQLILGNSSSIVGQGIYNRGSFNNNTGGEIKIDNATQRGLYNEGGSTFTNAAKITIGATASIGSEGIENRGTFNNNTGGDIKIDRTGRGLLNIEATFNNAALITIGASASVGPRGLNNFGTTAMFNNNMGGEIKIDNATQRGLYNEGGSTFTNAAKITIGATASIGGEGIDNRGTFNNNMGGDIKIDRTGRGLLNHTATFNNSGLITIGAMASVGQRGLNNFGATAIFNNNTGGEIKIDNSTIVGLYNEWGTITNSAKIIIGASATVGTNGLQNDDTFNNNACGEVIVVRGTLLNSAARTFTNAGLVKVSNTLTNNGTFTNNGILEYPQGNPIPNVTNNEIIIAPTTANACNVISPAFGLGSPVDFTIMGIFSDEAATMSAGTYVTATNTFTPTATLAEGTYSLFVKIQDGSGGCTRIVPWTLTTEDCCPATGAIWYVNAAAAPGGNGASWECAFQDLQLALAAASSGHQIWVAAGTYKPTSGANRFFAFNMKNGVEILGGFPNFGNPNLSNRNWATHITSLSGEIGAPGMADNSASVIYNININSTAVLDGFQVLFGNNTIGNLRGGGMHNDANSSPTIRNCTFMSNFSSYGGAVYNFTNCAPVFTNCAFLGNQSGDWGGACFSESSSMVTFINCSFSGNTGIPGVIYSNGMPAVLNNCIIWGNGTQAIAGLATITNSIIEGGYTGAGNLNFDPLFVSQPPVGLGTAGDLRLQICSPAIDAGNDSGAPATDLDKNARFNALSGGSISDIGAYEFQSAATPTVAICQSSINAVLDNTGQATVLATALNNGSVGCSPIVFSINGQSSASFNCSQTGNQTVTLTATYINRMATCTTTVNVIDNTQPTFTCPANRDVNLNATCQLVVPNLISGLTGTDNCGTVSFTQNPAANTAVASSHNGTVLVTITANDGNGNTSNCQVTLTGKDVTQPTFTCPANRDVNLNATCQLVVPTLISGLTGTDNCGTVSFTQNPAANTAVASAHNGTVLVTITANDGNGNTSNCSVTLTGKDVAQPSFACPANRDVNLNATCQLVVPNLISGLTGTDNCGTVSFTQNPTANTAVASSHNGTVLVTITANDGNGNTSNCQVTLTGKDVTQPSFACPANRDVNLNATCQLVVPNLISGLTGTDNCGTVSFTQNPAANTAVASSHNGTVLVTITANDGNGNTSNCQVTLTGKDVTQPTFTCPANRDVNLNATCQLVVPNLIGGLTGTDNCGTVSFTQNPAANTAVASSHNGTVLVTITANDGNGNTSNCSVTLTGKDVTPPTVVCKNTTVFLNAAGNYTLLAADVFNATASSDNCSGVLTVTNISPATVSCNKANQTIPVTVTVQDAAGNSATCMAQIVVQEGTTQPEGWSSNNVGNANGSGGYKPCTGSNGQFTVSATGFSTSSADVLHLTSRQLCGNGEIIARVANLSGGGWAGITLRETLTPGSKKVALKTQNNGNIRREIRTVTNGAVNNLNYLRPGHTWLRLVRNGNIFSGYTSANGTTWDFAFTATVSMVGCVYAGLFAESINTNVTTTATFDNVQVIGGTSSLVEAPQTPVAASNVSPEVYPNPTNGEVNIDLSGYADPVGTLNVFDAYGKLVVQQRLDGSPLFRIKLDGDDGVYFLSIEVEGEAPVTKRVVIAH
ncbi:MAG: choice-of-anchor Q domain-containing protein [Saprospiraceae bacterium]